MQSTAGIPFRLHPFPGEPCPENLSLDGWASRPQGSLRLTYRLSGDLLDLHIPEPHSEPRRLDDLWQSTCLECFLALPGDPAYWELNLSPAGHWNAYRLEGYRLGLAPEAAIGAPRLTRHGRADGLEVVMEVNLPAALAGAAVLELAVTAVIASRSGELSYWALCHSGDQPDFHRRESFTLRL